MMDFQGLCKLEQLHERHTMTNRLRILVVLRFMGALSAEIASADQVHHPVFDAAHRLEG